MLTVSELTKEDIGRGVIYRSPDGGSVVRRGKLSSWDGDMVKVRFGINGKTSPVSPNDLEFSDHEDMARELAGEEKTKDRTTLQIETFEREELFTDGEVVGVSEESKKLIEKMELEGQKQLYEESKDERLPPYRKMGKQEGIVYRAVLSEHDSVGNYSGNLMPLRVLQVVSHAKELFAKVEVWSSPDPDTDECMLIGTDKDYGYDSVFLLARWGRELLVYSVLKTRAGKVAKAKYRKSAARCLNEAQKVVDSISSTPDEEFIGKSDPSFYAN